MLRDWGHSMRMIFLLIIQTISCILAGWEVAEIIFFISVSVLWFLVFKYVFMKIREKSKRIVIDKSNGYIVFAGICAVLSPFLCFLSIVIYPLWLLNKTIKFAAIYWEGKKNQSLDSGCKLMGNNEESLYKVFPYINDPVDRPSIDSRRDHAIDTSCNTHEIRSANESVDSYNSGSTAWEQDINPASGLPMIGNIDVAGNPYGIDRHD